MGAAIAAARTGAKTALVERHPILGGMGTAALVNNFCNAYYDGRRFIIGGLFQEFRNRLIACGALYPTLHLEPYNHHAFCNIARELCETAGVSLHLGQPVIESYFGSNSASIMLNDETLHGKVVVDASGDAVIAAAQGVEMLPRESKSRLPMPLNYCYLLGPVDWQTIRNELPEIILTDRTGKEYLYLGPQPRLKEWIRQAREAGTLTIPRERIAVAYSVPQMEDYISVNFGRVTVADPSDPRQIRAAEEIGKQQVHEGEAFFRQYVPGFRNARVAELGLQIGVRESRQIRGQYVLTGEDVLACRQFEDVIAQCCYSVDIHEPNSDKTILIKLPEGQHYDIPLRCLVPHRGPGNLIVAGRSISATQTAMSSFRVSPSVMAIGEATGVAAALAAENESPVSAIPAKAVQDVLIRSNAILS